MKDNIKWLYIIIPVLITVIGNILYNVYGSKVKHKIFAIICAAIILLMLIGIAYLLIKKYYLLSLGCLCIIVPCIIIAIGVYTEKIKLVIIGIILIALVSSVIYIVLKMYTRNKK